MLAERPLLTALALSLAGHLVVLASTGTWQAGAPAEIAFPIEARLAATGSAKQAGTVAVPALPAPAPVARTQVLASPPATAAAPVIEAPAVASVTDPVSLPVAPPETPVTSPLASVSPAPPLPAATAALPDAQAAQGHDTTASTATVSADTRAPTRASVRALPASLEIRYSVQYGEGDFTAGEARYVWQSDAARYVLASSAQATGLASLFLSGQITQRSEGGIDTAGLRPEDFAERKGTKAEETAQFDWTRRQVRFGGQRGTAVLAAEAQDLLSLPFHLAMTVRTGEADFSIDLCNGRRLDRYRFHVLGEERIDLGKRSLRAVHVQGSREGAGSLDIWLDSAGGYLPVRIRSVDAKGKVIQLSAQEVRAR